MLGNEIFYHEFAERLKQSMLTAGLRSTRSPSGVCVQSLADMTGYSLQICRRYLKGEVIPEPNKLLIIAKRLNVTPGWLLFGDEPAALSSQLLISKDTLKAIIVKALALKAPRSPEALAEIILQFSADLSVLKASPTEIKNIIELSFKAIELSANQAP